MGITAIIAALLLALFLALLPGSAQAQQPAICQQYPDLPQCEELPADDDDDDDDDDLRQAGGGDGTGNADGGELPFTGYPLTPLLLLLIILLVVGMTIRAYVAVRERVRGRSAIAGYHDGS